MNKNTYLNLSILCFLFAGFSVLYCYIPRTHVIASVTPERTLDSYSNTELGISFQYHGGDNGFVLTNMPSKDEHAYLERELSLMTKEDSKVILSEHAPFEGPPMITVSIFKNPNNLSLNAWAESNKSYSNYGMKDGEPATLTISNANAIRYKSDGLYQADNVVIGNAGLIYLVSCAYVDELSSMHKDFLELLGSIEISDPHAPIVH